MLADWIQRKRKAGTQLELAGMNADLLFNVADTSLASTRERSRTLDGAWLLSGATVASGVLAYAYHVLAARALSGADRSARRASRPPDRRSA